MAGPKYVSGSILNILKPFLKLETELKTDKILERSTQNAAKTLTVLHDMCTNQSIIGYYLVFFGRDDYLIRELKLHDWKRSRIIYKKL